MSTWYARIEKCKRKLTSTNTTEKAERSEGSNKAKADRSEKILTYTREIESEVSSERTINKARFECALGNLTKLKRRRKHPFVASG